MSSLIQKNNLIQILIWLGLLLLLFVGLFSSEPEEGSTNRSEDLLIISLIWLSMITASYTALYLHTKLFQKQRYLLFSGAIVLALVGIVFSVRALSGLLLESSFIQSFYSDLVSYSFVMGISIGMRYAKQGLLDRYLLQEMQAQLLKAELDTLKSQINPHFLFNTLNNIYGVNLTDPEKGSEMILNLSEMFRYFLEAQKRDKVALGEELELIRNYIALERMRLTPANRIELKVQAEVPSRLLPPLLLMPLIENAVKYGVQPGKDTTISIDIQQGKQELTLTTQNELHPNHRTTSTRTGLKNLKERLERLYPGRFTLHSAAAGNRWQAKLIIPL